MSEAGRGTGSPEHIRSAFPDVDPIKIVGLAHRFGQSGVAPKTTCRLG